MQSLRTAFDKYVYIISELFECPCSVWAQDSVWAELRMAQALPKLGIGPWAMVEHHTAHTCI